MQAKHSDRSTARFRLFVSLILILSLVPVAVYAAGGPFTDDDSSMFEPDIEWMAANGITFGCNPPTNDRFCPDANVTRGQMAAFMHRFADSQRNTAYQVGVEAATAIVVVDMYETVLELTGLPAGTYHVTAKGEFRSSELMTQAVPSCKLMAGHEFDTTLPTVDPGRTVPWSLSAVTYMGEDNSSIHLDCRDHGEMVTLAYTRLTAMGVDDIDIQLP